VVTVGRLVASSALALMESSWLESKAVSSAVGSWQRDSPYGAAGSLVRVFCLGSSP